ncbi:MAG TPA: sulfotransferase domain-containing protein [Blastocatellia bacterium]|nr:sulfotransferase domain-containing protein [Blastocatellia bacterium]
MLTKSKRPADHHLHPSFFIIGANKCGTSSLYRYLVSHPNVLPCKKKEPNFFGQHSPDYIESHIDDYYGLFPAREHQGDLSFVWEASDAAGRPELTRVQVQRDPDRNYITGEASANTFHDVPPALLHKYLPDIKLILLLRNPIDRAYSHYRMYQRFRASGHDLGFELKDLETDIIDDLAAYLKTGASHYISIGIYVDKLREWVGQFGWSNIKLVISEELAETDKAEQIMSSLEDYLEIPHHQFGEILNRRFNHAPSSGTSVNSFSGLARVRISESDTTPGVRALLSDFYQPYNRSLAELLGYDLPWC